jgi:NAD(P)H-dependent FMN reductase
MRLLLLNGSPRPKSNTGLLLDHFRRGLGPGHAVEELSLRRAFTEDFPVARFTAADAVILAFPLYSDAMPSIVKRTIEQLAPLCARAANPPLGFIVQSGFPETMHSRPVERYLEKLAGRLHSPYLGTVIRGGVEGIQVMPAWMTRRLFARFAALGRRFGETGRLDPALIAELAGRERMTWRGRLAFRLGDALGLTRWYWDSQLKKHGAFARRFAQPHAVARPDAATGAAPGAETGGGEPPAKVTRGNIGALLSSGR